MVKIQTSRYTFRIIANLCYSLSCFEISEVKKNENRLTIRKEENNI